MTRRARQEGSVYQRKDGRWVASVHLGWQGGKRQRRDLYAKTKAEAKALLKGAVESRDLTGSVPSVRLTVGAFLAQWCDGLDVRPSTARSYRMICEQHLTPSLGRISLARLGIADIERYLVSAGASGLSPRTVHHHHAVLRRALGDAERWGLVTRNAAKLVRGPRVPHVAVSPLTPEEAQQFLETTKGDRLHGLWSLALATGMRQGELLGLAWEDVDLESARVHVRLALQWIDGKPELVEPKTKSSRRSIPLSQLAVDALRRHKARQAKERLALGDRWQDRGFVFAASKGLPLQSSVVVHSFHHSLEAAGLRRVRFHDLRHTAATLMLLAGVPLRVVMEILGHSSISITANTYAHVLPSLSVDAAERLARTLTQPVAVTVAVNGPNGGGRSA